MSAYSPHRAEARPRRASYQPLVIVLAAVCAGIMADRFRPLPWGVWWLVAVAAWSGWLILWRRGRWQIASGAILLAAAASGAAWHHGCWHLFRADDLGCFARAEAQPVCIEARALKTPRLIAPADAGPMSPVRSGSRVHLDIELLALRNGAEWRPVSGRSQLSVEGLLPGVEAGDRLQVFGKLIAPRPRITPANSTRPNNCAGSACSVSSAPATASRSRVWRAAVHGGFHAGWKKSARMAIGFSRNTSIPAAPRLPRPCCLAHASKSSLTASSRSWKPARSICWSLPACTWAC